MDERMMESRMSIEPDELTVKTQDEAPQLQTFVSDTRSSVLENGDQSLEALYDVPVKVQAVLGRARMPIGDLLKLQIGTVVELDRRVGEPIDIFVNNRLIARGEVVMIENALGVTLTEIVREES
jgi:flagellar motor switch protein FliN/FliY